MTTFLHWIGVGVCVMSTVCVMGALIDWVLTLVLQWLKSYALVCDYIWHRKAFKRWNAERLSAAKERADA